MNKSKNRKKCLLICATPLQVLIAEKIISLNSEKDFYLVFTDHNYENKAKFTHYYNRLKSQCLKSIYWTDDPGLKNFLEFKSYFRYSGMDLEYSEIYLANIERRHFQYLFSRNINASLFTFDDGIGNINRNSYFYSNKKPSFIKRIIWNSLGVKHFTPDLRKNSKLHFTIYKDLPNIIHQTYYLSLYNSDLLQEKLDSDDSYKSRRSINIYLGQPLDSIDDKFNEAYIFKILNKLDINYYFPHPRENVSPSEQISIINSELVFEDYIIEYLKEHPYTYVNVYSFISGALLNINQIRKVRVKFIFDNTLQKKYKTFYSLIQDNFTIETIKP